MTRGIPLVLLTTLLSLAGCGQRECEYVKTTKGDQICREDLESAPAAESVRPEKPAWRDERSPAKDE